MARSASSVETPSNTTPPSRTARASDRSVDARDRDDAGFFERRIGELLGRWKQASERRWPRSMWRCPIARRSAPRSPAAAVTVICWPRMARTASSNPSRARPAHATPAGSPPAAPGVRNPPPDERRSIPGRPPRSKTRRTRAMIRGEGLQPRKPDGHPQRSPSARTPARTAPLHRQRPGQSIPARSCGGSGRRGYDFNARLRPGSQEGDHAPSRTAAGTQGGSDSAGPSWLPRRPAPPSASQYRPHRRRTGGGCRSQRQTSVSHWQPRLVDQSFREVDPPGGPPPSASPQMLHLQPPKRPRGHAEPVGERLDPSRSSAPS